MARDNFILTFEFIILEQNGEIDEQHRQYTLEEGMVAAGKFLSLFINDPLKRVARVAIDTIPMVTLDSEKGMLWFGSHKKQGVVKL